MNKIKRKIYIDKIIKVIKNDFPLFKNLKLYGFYDQLSNDEMDYVLSGVFEQPVKVKGYGHNSIGLGIFNDKKNMIYNEQSNGKFWKKYQYDENGNKIYQENSDGYWLKKEYDERGNEIYYESSIGYWEKREYDENNNILYSENSNVYIKYYK